MLLSAEPFAIIGVCYFIVGRLRILQKVNFETEIISI